MTLEDKINNINSAFSEDKVPRYTKGKSKTIEDFWRDFVEPRLPK